MAAAEPAKKSVEAVNELQNNLTRDQATAPPGDIATFESEAERLRAERLELENQCARLEGANSALQAELRGWRQQVERLAHRATDVRQERDAMQELNRQLQAELRELRQVLNELDARHRLDDLEKSVQGIYQSRIWRTLVALSSPIEKLFRSPGK